MSPPLPPVAVVTGATSGLGQAAALGLARVGWHVVLVGRDEARGAETLAGVRAVGFGEWQAADLFSAAGTAALASRLREIHPHIGLLINNAGGAFGRSAPTADGFDRTFALNVAAPFVLTEGLADRLAGGRVVNVVTGIQQGNTATMDQLLGGESGFGGYIRAKLALLALTVEGQARHPDITFVALHPGVVPDTRFGSETPAWLRGAALWIAKAVGLTSPLDQVVERYVAVGTGLVVPGGFYFEGVLRETPKQALDPAFRTALWTRLAALEPAAG